ncbi:uncharacterized protein LOC105702990 [Orussus abietinus]|uniref:uncharacterized protein LOC105702990 n=1 Tax=Orussus abietinus TaxID=222816 RepID=UPI00062633B7|nr:uncharacterized protein LOC105702990 [Orussus abietinus]
MAPYSVLLVSLVACVACLPAIEESTDTAVSQSIENASTASTVLDIVDHSTIDMVSTTKAPSTSVVFVNVPAHTETELGSSVLLACRTASPVAECQWSWQPLPPTHLPLPDISEDPSLTALTAEFFNTSASRAPTTQPLPVRLFPAFGNNSNDCSVRFSSTKHEQTGYWTCAARTSINEPFTSTEPAKLSIINDNKELPITFEKSESTVEAPAGSSTQIMCRTNDPVQECQWSWRQLNQSQPWNLEVKKFAAFGNDSTDCSIKFKNVLPEQEGFWTCGARINPNSSFVHSSPIKFLISEVEFVQLSRGIQIAAGETVFLRCLSNKPVVQCEWSWRPTNSSKESTVVKKFEPSEDADHDCSVRFKNILYEEEGLWTCGVRLTPGGILHEAPPATVTLLPSAKTNFVEVPEDTSVPLGTEALLKCVTSGRVDKCSWTWRPLTGSNAEVIVREFPSGGDLGRDCSLKLPRVFAEEQGHWGCQVSITSLNTILSSPIAKVTVFEEDEVKFSELSQDIQISSGGSVLLRCVTSSAVEQCRWSLTPVNSNTTVVVKQFPAAGTEARDCSVRLSHALAEQEGLWTCGARLRSRQNYTDAPPAKLSLLQPEPATVTLWAIPHQKVTLACRVGHLTPEVQCEWLHPPNLQVRQSTSKKSRHVVQMNYSTGICTLQFKPESTDLGHWSCKFTIPDENGEIELGSSSIVLLNSLGDEKLGWIVGALTAVILLLMIIVVVLVVCKARLFARKAPAVMKPVSETPKRKRNERFCNDRYTEPPSKIQFCFNEQDSDQNISTISSVIPNRSPHLYERVELRNNRHASKVMHENYKR